MLELLVISISLNLIMGRMLYNAIKLLSGKKVNTLARKKMKTDLYQNTTIGFTSEQ